MRQFLPRLKQQLPEGCAVIDDATLQGPIAQPEFARHGRYFRPVSREQALENPFHLLTDRTLRTALFTLDEVSALPGSLWLSGPQLTMSVWLESRSA